MSLRHAVLGLLAEGAAGGYDLLKLFDTALANVWPAAQSQVYTELITLAEANLVTASAAGARGRKEYAITDAGVAELRRWLADTPTWHDRRSEARPHVFFLGQVAPADAHRYLVDWAERRRDLRRLRRLRDQDDWDVGDNLVRYGRLVLEYGVRQAECAATGRAGPPIGCPRPHGHGREPRPIRRCRPRCASAPPGRPCPSGSAEAIPLPGRAP